MANQSKKKDKGTRNPERRNGKAWKKDKGQPKAVTKTPERAEKDAVIRAQRELRRQANVSRRAAERAAEAAKTAEKQAQKKAAIDSLAQVAAIAAKDRAATEMYFYEAREFVKAILPVM